MPRVVSRHYGASLVAPAGASATTALDASLSPSGDVTLAGWIRAANPPGSGEYAIASLVNSDRSDGLLIYCSTLGGNPFSFIASVRNGSLARCPASTSAAMVGQWRRVVVTLTASTKTISVYVDGVNVVTVASAWTGSFAATCKLTVGSPAMSIDSGVELDDVIVDNGHAWTAAQVAADNYANQQPATITHRWPLDDGAGATARATLGGLPLTLAGGAAWSADSPMLARGSVRNLVAQSDQYALSPWVPNAITLGAYSGPMPTSGPTIATLLTDTVANATHQVSVTVGVPATALSTPYILSCYLLNVTGAGWMGFQLGQFVILYEKADGTSAADGSAGGTSLGHGSVDAGSGWTRAWIRVPYGAFYASRHVNLIMCSAAFGYPYAGVGNQIAVAGAMLEQCAPGQLTPSPYVATGAAPLSVYGMRAGAPRSAAGARTAAGTRLVVT